MAGIRDRDLADRRVEEGPQPEGGDVEPRAGRDPERDPADGVEEGLAVGQSFRREAPRVLRVGRKEEVEGGAVLDLCVEAARRAVGDGGTDAARRGGRCREDGVERELQVGRGGDADLAGQGLGTDGARRR